MQVYGVFYIRVKGVVLAILEKTSQLLVQEVRTVPFFFVFFFSQEYQDDFITSHCSFVVQVISGDISFFVQTLLRRIQFLCTSTANTGKPLSCKVLLTEKTKHERSYFILLLLQVQYKKLYLFVVTIYLICTSVYEYLYL